jgi:signal transduction histidine kinase
MSHELRTPLNAITARDLLDAGIPQAIGDQARAQVKRIQHGAQHLLEVIEAVLTLARSEVYTEAVHLETVDIRDTVKAAVELTRPLAARKDLPIECSFDDSLVPVRTDAQKVRQILVNLIGNAIKFTSSGEIRIEAVRNRHDVRCTCVIPARIAPDHL